MKIARRVVDTIEARSIRVFAKLRDQGSYTLTLSDGTEHERQDCYVPNNIVPGEYGDYIDLVIDIDSGVVLNWKKPDPHDVSEFFFGVKE